MIIRKRQILATCSVLALTATQASAIGVTPTANATDLANTLFLNSPSLMVTGATVFGEFGQAGTFTNASGTYGLPNSGIVLSSGNVSDYADGPDDENGFTTDFCFDASCGEIGGVPASADQEALLGPITGQNSHFDTAQLNIEFNVGQNVDQVSFFGTFGSEEFPDFVGSDVNDGFGLFVNGQNVAGVMPAAGGANLPVNISHPDFAPIPGTELNGVLAPGGNAVLRFDVPVNPGEINDFQIIIADATDAAYDSTVYLSSFIPSGNPGDTGGPPSTGDGSSEFNPILPSNPPDPDTGEFVIALPEPPADGGTVWVDPPVAVGYTYSLNMGQTFTSITAPSLATIADLDGFFITVGPTTIALGSGATLADLVAAFGVAPSEFTLTGIDPALMLDPANSLAFPLGIMYTFVDGVTLSMTPIIEDFGVPEVPLPAGLPLYLGGLIVSATILRRKSRKET